MIKVFILALTLLLSGCINHQATIHADAGGFLNPDSNNHSKPIVISLYELTKPYPFKQVSYNTLTTNIESALGETLIDYKTFEIRPNETKTLSIKLPSDMNYLGITAGFHHLSISQWRETLFIHPNYKQAIINIHVDSNHVHAHLTETYL